MFGSMLGPGSTSTTPQESEIIRIEGCGDLLLVLFMNSDKTITE